MTQILLVWIALFGLAGPLHAQAAASADEAAVLATIQNMFDAMRSKDTAGLRAVFEPGARLVGLRTRNDGSVVTQSLSVSDWVRFLGQDPRPDWTERAFHPEVRIHGTLATVWAEYDFHFGSRLANCGIDAVQLLLIGGQWKIVSIADTYQREGCPDRPPPP